ncbi:unnamed protein product, partial [Meganyctiphanes norvegica]
VKIWFQNRRSKYKKLYKAAQNGQLPGVDPADIAADLGANISHMCGPESPGSPPPSEPPHDHQQPPSAQPSECPLSPPPDLAERPHSQPPTSSHDFTHHSMTHPRDMMTSPRDMMASPRDTMASPREMMTSPPLKQEHPSSMMAMNPMEQHVRPREHPMAPHFMQAHMQAHPQWDPAHYMSYWNHYGDAAHQMNQQIMT